MSPTLTIAMTAALVARVACSAGAAEPSRWTAEQAWAWYKKQPWIVGLNYVPSTACNTTEFWSADTFDEKTIVALNWRVMGIEAARRQVYAISWTANRSARYPTSCIQENTDAVSLLLCVRSGALRRKAANLRVSVAGAVRLRTFSAKEESCRDTECC